jgi:hypothetical protein
LALLPPAVAVTEAVPGLTAFTRPFSTVTEDGLLLAQVTVLSVASEGDTVAVRLTDPPTDRVTEVWLKETPETATTGSSLGPQAVIKSAASAKNKEENKDFMAIFLSGMKKARNLSDCGFFAGWTVYQV